ncbi:hypothetical protein [Ornithinimicrobium sp. INDO-MA30-4]|uniref:hypothetical protein n=1 Tax=Ornithinimicrobium sp. INDO-MA30-4 TaxID=2908651 RepID=UPI001F30731A|nr:hypothetical protein [Ornithinimicrobium sp. INDO-MA30-4]UJH69558.1 hypothetical protein L0A91_09275 [Ornithinimicrobium sp. INDO-MA30-4]
MSINGLNQHGALTDGINVGFALGDKGAQHVLPGQGVQEVFGKFGSVRGVDAQRLRAPSRIPRLGRTHRVEVDVAVFAASQRRAGPRKGWHGATAGEGWHAQPSASPDPMPFAVFGDVSV